MPIELVSAFLSEFRGLTAKLTGVVSMLAIAVTNVW
jgi:hypothetical protein